MEFFKKLFGRKLTSNNKVLDVAKSELEKNIEAIKSLRDYDEGKKDISTDDIERRMRDLQATPQR